jgi:hypothetical protein
MTPTRWLWVGKTRWDCLRWSDLESDETQWRILSNPLLVGALVAETDTIEEGGEFRVDEHTVVERIHGDVDARHSAELLEQCGTRRAHAAPPVCVVCVTGKSRDGAVTVVRSCGP